MDAEVIDINLPKGKAICFDFDGVIHKYSKGWQDGSIYDEPNIQIIKLISMLQVMGTPVFICSSRKPEQICKWWKENINLNARIVDDNTEFWDETTCVGITNRKLPALYYIDDRAYLYKGQDIIQILKDLGE